jgi:glutathione S-transferase
MKVFGFPRSTCTRKVMMTLVEKNIPFTLEHIDLPKGEHKQSAHMARHPFGVVPVLDDDGFVLYESRAIMRYLDRHYLTDVVLTPHDIHEYGYMEQWINVEQSYFSGPAVQLIKQLYWGPMQGQMVDQEVVSHAKERVIHALNVIEKVLRKHDYLAGDSFSLADISWMPYVDYLFYATMGQLITERSTVHAWWERVSKRPTWSKVLNWK